LAERTIAEARTFAGSKDDAPEWGDHINRIHRSMSHHCPVGSVEAGAVGRDAGLANPDRLVDLRRREGQLRRGHHGGGQQQEQG